VYIFSIVYNGVDAPGKNEILFSVGAWATRRRKHEYTRRQFRWPYSLPWQVVKNSFVLIVLSQTSVAWLFQLQAAVHAGNDESVGHRCVCAEQQLCSSVHSSHAISPPARQTRGEVDTLSSLFFL